MRRILCVYILVFRVCNRNSIDDAIFANTYICEAITFTCNYNTSKGTIVKMNIIEISIIKADIDKCTITEYNIFYFLIFKNQAGKTNFTVNYYCLCCYKAIKQEWQYSSNITLYICWFPVLFTDIH